MRGVAKDEARTSRTLYLCVCQTLHVPPSLPPPARMCGPSRVRNLAGSKLRGWSATVTSHPSLFPSAAGRSKRLLQAGMAQLMSAVRA